MQFLFFMDYFLFHQLDFLYLFLQFLVLDSAELFIENLIFFHPDDNIFKGFGLHFSVFFLSSNRIGLFFFINNFLF